MTIDQFNKEYKIEASIQAIQRVQLIPGEDGDVAELQYGIVDSIESTSKYTVVSRETNQVVLTCGSEDMAEDTITDEIINHFNIQ